MCMCRLFTSIDVMMSAREASMLQLEEAATAIARHQSKLLTSNDNATSVVSYLSITRV